MISQKTTSEIQKLLSDANIDFDSAVNKALNDYLPKLLFMCPFTNQPCMKKQCMGCATLQTSNKKGTIKEPSIPIITADT